MANNWNNSDDKEKEGDAMKSVPGKSNGEKFRNLGKRFREGKNKGDGEDPLPEDGKKGRKNNKKQIREQRKTKKEVINNMAGKQPEEKDPKVVNPGADAKPDTEVKPADAVHPSTAEAKTEGSAAATAGADDKGERKQWEEKHPYGKGINEGARLERERQEKEREKERNKHKEELRNAEARGREQGRLEERQVQRQAPPLRQQPAAQVQVQAQAAPQIQQKGGNAVKNSGLIALCCLLALALAILGTWMVARQPWQQLVAVPVSVPTAVPGYPAPAPVYPTAPGYQTPSPYYNYSSAGGNEILSVVSAAFPGAQSNIMTWRTYNLPATGWVQGYYNAVTVTISRDSSGNLQVMIRDAKDGRVDYLNTYHQFRATTVSIN